MESKLLAQTCARLADNKKAENITLLDLRELSSVADYFVIATGSNEPHLRAIVDEITEKPGWTTIFAPSPPRARG